MNQGLTRTCKPFLFLERKEYGKSTENRYSVEVPAIHSIANGGTHSGTSEGSEPVRFRVERP
jgi:hypothetical protein